MIFIRKLGAAVALFTALSTIVIAPAAAKDNAYAAAVDISKIVPPPPDAAATRAELDLMVKRQAERTPEQEARAIADEKRNARQFLTGAGIDVRKRDVELLEALVKRMRASESLVMKPAKRLFHRERPFVGDKRILVLSKTPTSESYPSSHAAFGGMVGTVLARMLPEERKAIEARIQDFADSRVIAGAHHPSDVAAGVKVGVAIADALFEDPSFRKDYSAARSQLRLALKLPL
ncbi:phosphatase PAP2 family protein [Terrarubrum flagellatum]|uniref:phosphatase PAP2 family protein n=1 Tax=Terrirubrum flagellatum TaxID=2895980 RepID=UPI0031450DD0